ncbi:squalene/phytoene synthase family protein [Pelagibius litoralis]|uniref:Squalene/phytoene synthase family protein n=1 Tax=Pelagibius litoralis TaxID=374515 RepID=A0A967CAN9_9PROT|nr:phytoene/squalene synthase family protein [Pelagibius litoralis]NIA67559.1 squalene/phytoene synthase family protein [Pelagibius litoralis]
MTALPGYVESLRQHDRDRYQTCLFAPARAREHLFALYAFNYEIAKTAEVVSEVMLGHIRLQWWRESLEGIYAGTPRSHEVVEPLARAVAAAGLRQEDLEALVTAREFDLEEEPPADLAALEHYARGTSGVLQQLALKVLAVESAGAEEAAEQVGIAWALVGLLRAVPFHARQKRLYLPVDLCHAADLHAGPIFELQSSDALAEVSRAIAQAATAHLEKARVAAGSVPRKAIPALLLAPLADHHLKRLAKVGHDPFHPDLQQEAPGQIWRLAWWAWRGRY